MSVVKQVGLLPAGCQPWNNDVCAASGDRFAYCATLAIYVYQYDHQYNEFRLHAIMSEHKKTITAISWHPRNSDLIASSGADSTIIIWNMSTEHVIARLENIRGIPSSIGWCPHEKDILAFVFGRGPLFLWNHTSQPSALTQHKEAQNFTSDVCQFRWHPKKMGKIVFGHRDGSISIFCPGTKPLKHVLRPEDLESAEEDDPVNTIEWDPLSVEYLLLANRYHGMRLVDTETLATINRFQLPSAAAVIHTVSWIHSAPGMFVTGDSNTGVMRLWNVSKSTPIENIRLKRTGFHALHILHMSHDASNSGSLTGSPCHLANNAGTSPTGHTPLTRFALPPAHALCTFMDGGVGLYDLGRRKWNFIRDQGHVETIFDCKFHPENPDLLATGSFDGTIKVWDVNTLSALQSSPGNEGVIYSLSWAPADLNCIVASTSRQGAFIWDITKGKVIKRFTEHGKVAVYSVAWNPKDSRRIASCGADGYCIVRQVDGQPIIKYKHPASVFGCDWSPNNKDMLATGCEDKCVRVYYLCTNKDTPLKIFTGHSAKVFHVRWSPLRDGILCSGSDDGTIRIWDYTQDTCVSVLSGHTAPVRGLLWNTEIPYLLISGSWDYSIRIWDTRDGACLDTVLDHGADVYGLTCHVNRPFVLATCSRDSTVRTWSLTPLVQPLEMNIIAKRPWTEIMSSTEHALVGGTPPLLSGKVSRDLKFELEEKPGDDYLQTVAAFSKFFMSPGGPSNVWELVEVIKGKDPGSLSKTYSKGIMHTKHLIKFKNAGAQELEMVRTSKFGGGLGAPSREDRLREASNLYIRLGNVQRYCELLVELGEWEKALAVAPSVSMKYWKQLAQRYAQALAGLDSDDLIPFCVATGDADGLVEFFISRGQLHDAFITATAAQEGSISKPAAHASQLLNGNQETEDPESRVLLHTSERLAEWYFGNGSPALAACCHLAVDDYEKALQKLIRGNELELAISVGHVLGKLEPLTSLATELLSRRCEKLGRWDLAVDLLKTIPNADLPLAKVCARCAACVVEINDLHSKAGFDSMEDCLKQAETLKVKSGGTLQCLKYYMMSSSPDIGLQYGLKHVKGVLSQTSWVIDDVFEYLQLMAAIKTERLQQNKCAKLRQELLVLCAYIGALAAVRRQYDSVVLPLFQHSLWLMKREKSELPLSESLVQSEMDAWQAHSCLSRKGSQRSGGTETSMTAEQQKQYEHLLAKLGEEHYPGGVGRDVVVGSQLPSHSDLHHSYFDGSRIQGPAYFLEDGRSAISISDALMWAKVNPFSPLGSGVRLNPF